MKFTRLLSVLALAAMLFVSKAEAATIDLGSVNAGTFATPTVLDQGSYLLMPVDYDLFGSLTSGTTLTLTFAATNVRSEALSSFGISAPRPFVEASYALGASGTIEVGTSYAASTGDLVSTIVLSNTSAGILDFSSAFDGFLLENVSLSELLAILTGGGTDLLGTYTLTASTVPLPPALLLFGSGLVAFAGFGRRKNA